MKFGILITTLLLCPSLLAVDWEQVYPEFIYKDYRVACRNENLRSFYVGISKGRAVVLSSTNSLNGFADRMSLSAAETSNVRVNNGTIKEWTPSQRQLKWIIQRKFGMQCPSKNVARFNSTAVFTFSPSVQAGIAHSSASMLSGQRSDNHPFLVKLSLTTENQNKVQTKEAQ